MGFSMLNITLNYARSFKWPSPDEALAQKQAAPAARNHQLSFCDSWLMYGVPQTVCAAEVSSL